MRDTRLFIVGQIVATPFCGWAADRFGRRPILLLSNLLYSVLSIGLVFSRDYISFVILRFCTGLATQASLEMLKYADMFAQVTFLGLKQLLLCTSRGMAAPRKKRFMGCDLGSAVYCWHAHHCLCCIAASKLALHTNLPGGLQYPRTISYLVSAEIRHNKALRKPR